jgi:hypothetical protein
MKTWKVSVFVVGLIFFSILLFFLIHQHDREYTIELANNISNSLSNFAINFSVVFFVFFFGALAGFAWYLSLQILDSLVDKDHNFTTIHRILLGILGAMVLFLIYTITFRGSLELPDTWLRTIATTEYFGWRPWTGEYDRSPVLWGIYGFLTFILGYFVSPKIIGPIDSIVNTFRFRNSG